MKGHTAIIAMVVMEAHHLARIIHDDSSPFDKLRVARARFS
jgi:hypothetical protein